MNKSAVNSAERKRMRQESLFSVRPTDQFDRIVGWQRSTLAVHAFDVDCKCTILPHQDKATQIDNVTTQVKFERPESGVQASFSRLPKLTLLVHRMDGE